MGRTSDDATAVDREVGSSRPPLGSQEFGPWRPHLATHHHQELLMVTNFNTQNAKRERCGRRWIGTGRRWIGRQEMDRKAGDG